MIAPNVLILFDKINVLILGNDLLSRKLGEFELRDGVDAPDKFNGELSLFKLKCDTAGDGTVSKLLLVGILSKSLFVAPIKPLNPFVIALAPTVGVADCDLEVKCDWE